MLMVSLLGEDEFVNDQTLNLNLSISLASQFISLD